MRLILPVALLGSAGTGALLLSLPSSAAALPSSSTSCSGSLSPDAGGTSVGEPDLLDYSFYCSNEITSYSIIINRVRTDGDNVDDYSTNPIVNDPTTGEASTTESVACGGETPSDGINCYSLVGATAGPISPGFSIVGSIDPTAQYCAYLPKGAPAGTPAVPRAIVELIVTDNSGAEDGPFELSPTKPCAKVPAVVPAKKATAKPVVKGERTSGKAAVKKSAVKG